MPSRAEASRKGAARAMEGRRGELLWRRVFALFVCTAPASGAGDDKGRAYLLRVLLQFLHLRVFVSRSFFHLFEGYGSAEEHAPSGTTWSRRRNGFLRGAAWTQHTCKTSVPQQHSFSVLREYAYAWCEFDEETSSARGQQTSVPALPKPSRGSLPCTQHRTGAQIWDFGLPTCTLESSFPLSHCILPDRVTMHSQSVWLRLSNQASCQIAPCASAAQVVTSCLAPHLMTPSAGPVLGHVRDLVPACTHASFSIIRGINQDSNLQKTRSLSRKC